MAKHRQYPVVYINEKAERSLRGGHPWVYGEEVTHIEGEYVNGQIADVFSEKDRYLGSGFINDHSKILVRVISGNTNDRYDDAFFERRLRYAVDYRRTVMGERDFKCCRLIFGEADQFPGLTVDRFENVLSVQIACLGIDLRKRMLLDTLVRILRGYGETIDVVYIRTDPALCEKEGMEAYEGFFDGEGLATDGIGETVITENGIRYHVDFIGGQKTGFFVDQKYNRAAVARIAKGRRVLDCFTHTGAFALNVAAAGADHVTAVDISEEAIGMAKRNAELNGLSDRMSFITSDVFKLLTEMAEKGSSDYDLIILDPPAFTKSRRTVQDAERGYKEINMKAMKLLPRGGYLATCSCSHFMTEGLFKKMLHSAARDAGVSLRQIEARQQAPDHPILWGVPETYYLKFFIFQVV
ncbi:MAG: class I SAM-dependent rRNA methyltransferase [Firmicutes bacterium]|nr:class I SAM-dependent rRNA methyltransferase [Bacillota bacterium]